MTPWPIVNAIRSSGCSDVLRTSVASVIDGPLAATAATNGLPLVTRNDRAMVLNPFRIGENTIDRSIGGFRIARRTGSELAGHARR
jgi:hypothetical protein